eukprot:8766556-Lingulodinium_polyedra.AAC.1
MPLLVETGFCRREWLCMGMPSAKTFTLDCDRLVVGSPAMSVSENTCKWTWRPSTLSSLLCGSRSSTTRSRVPTRYRTVRFSAVNAPTVGPFRYWPSIETSSWASGTSCT